MSGAAEPLYAVSEATITLFGVDLIFCHLNNGERVITEDSVIRLFEAMGQPGTVGSADEAMAAIRELLA